MNQLFRAFLQTKGQPGSLRTDQNLQTSVSEGFHQVLSNFTTCTKITMLQQPVVYEDSVVQTLFKTTVYCVAEILAGVSMLTS